MAWNWKTMIPGYGWYEAIKNGVNNIKSNGYQFGDIARGIFGFTDDNKQSTVSDNITDAFNSHNVSQTLDQNGYQQVEVTPSDPTSSASNVINYDPNKSALENMLGYAQANNSASAYNDYLQTSHNMEMSNTALSRAIADAEANGISKYQLFQSGNAAASTPSSGSSLATSYENAMNRRESWNEKELAVIERIVQSTVSSAFKLLK